MSNTAEMLKAEEAELLVESLYFGGGYNVSVEFAFTLPLMMFLNTQSVGFGMFRQFHISSGSFCIDLSPTRFSL